MTIDPKDIKTLLIRVTLVTLAVRFVPLLMNDPLPTEAATALGLGVDGNSLEWTACLARAWSQITGAMPTLMRAPLLLADLALPALAVAMTRAMGWGALPGLMAGLLFAIAPLGIESGFRVDAGAPWAVIALTALVLLRQGLAQRQVARIAASGIVLLIGGVFAAPVLLVVPGGLYLAARLVLPMRLRGVALASWGIATLAALSLHYALFGYLLPEADAVSRWLVGPAMAGQPSAWAVVGPWQGALQALAAVAPAGPTGEIAQQLYMISAPLWAQALAGLLLLLALVGAWRGFVQADPPPPPQDKPVLSSPLAANQAAPHVDDPLDDATFQGAGAADAWQTLGVQRPVTPRKLGDRDLMPLILMLLSCLAFAAQAAWRGQVDGLWPALQVGRVATALLLGVGLVALTLERPGAPGSAAVVRRRRAQWTMGLAALTVFALGAEHLMATARSVERLATRKVSARVQAQRSNALAEKEKIAVLCLGPRGVSVLALIDPLRTDPSVQLASLDPADAISKLTELLVKHPSTIVLAGDRDVLVESASATANAQALAGLGQTLDASLQLSGLQPQLDSAGALADVAVLTYRRGVPADPRMIKPQLAPGIAP